LGGWCIRPTPATENFGLERLLTLEPVPFGAKVVDIREHPGQQGFGRQCVYPCAVKPKDILPLAGDLGAHPLDFGSELVKLHDVLVQIRQDQDVTSIYARWHVFEEKR
jgi:hypothetical protein